MSVFVDLQHGDSRELLRGLPDNFVDAIVTDGPYGLGFMGKEWDTFKPGVESTRIVENRAVDSDNPNLKGRSRGPASSPSAVEYDRTLEGQRRFQEWTAEWAREAIRVLKPGGHLVSFGAPRAHHRMMSGLEDAGFEIRDCLAWMFGQGFPKSLNLKGEWEGWSTALKPAFEPIALARKPFKGSLTKNVETWGVGALNVDGTRIPTEDGGPSPSAARRASSRKRGNAPMQERTLGVDTAAEANELGRFGRRGDPSVYMAERASEELGRWPAGVVLDEEAAVILDSLVGQHVSRFFYCPKVSRAEREFGCDSLPARTAGEMTGGREEGSAGLNNPRAGAGRTSGSRNAHPTVKPIALMRWLVRLVTPPDGIVLDPFLGSGTTGIAAALEGFNFIGMEQEAEWVAVAEARIAAWREKETAA